jgi:hypothetical protein
MGMEWFKITAGFWSHPKIIGLSDRAYRVLTSSWGYAAQHGTGGRINRAALRVIGGSAGTAGQLVRAGLWHPDGDGWVIHDWDDHQEAAVAIEERRRRDRERKQNERSVRGMSADIPRTFHGQSEDIPSEPSADIPSEPSADIPRREEKRREEKRREPPQTPPSQNDADPPPWERTPGRGRPTLAEQIARAEQLVARHTVNGRIVYDPTRDPDPERG